MELTTILIILAVVLLCPVSMFWMMRRHRRMGGEGSAPGEISSPPDHPRSGVDTGRHV